MVRPRKAVVVLAGTVRAGESAARALAESLSELGVETTYLGREESACEIAAVVDQEGADTVEVCVPTGGHGVVLLRDLLRELIRLGRRDVSIVAHRVESLPERLTRIAR